MRPLCPHRNGRVPLVVLSMMCTSSTSLFMMVHLMTYVIAVSTHSSIASSKISVVESLSQGS